MKRFFGGLFIGLLVFQLMMMLWHWLIMLGEAGNTTWIEYLTLIPDWITGILAEEDLLTKIMGILMLGAPVCTAVSGCLRENGIGRVILASVASVIEVLILWLITYVVIEVVTRMVAGMDFLSAGIAIAILIGLMAPATKVVLIILDD